MITLFWAAKGGMGTTVVAASTALVSATSGQPTVLIDLAGDVPAALGLSDPVGPGLADWLAGATPADRLARLELAATRQLTVLPLGGASPNAATTNADRVQELAGWVRSQSRHVVVDAGAAPPASLVDVADHAVLVTRPCYLALRAAARGRVRPTAVVVIEEPGRALSTTDIECALGAPVVATLLLDPAVARAVDAGLLAARLPRAYERQLRWAA